MKQTIKKLVLVIALLISGTAYGQNPFITKWEVESGEELLIGMLDAYHYVVEDLDGIVVQSGSSSDDLTLSGLETGQYLLKITPNENAVFTLKRFYMLGNGIPYSRDNLIELVQWGDIQWQSMKYMFNNCKNMIVTATDMPDLSLVTNIENLFSGCQSIETIPNIELWNTENITNMSKVFSKVYNFNQDVGNWNVSNVTEMNGLFEEATIFNQDLDGWDMLNVINMQNMFNRATNFNGNIENWNVSNVKNMRGLFYKASSFNRNIGLWDVGNVEIMRFMFSEATSFNQNIGNWNVSKVEDMYYMFNMASAFNQDISSWNVANVEDMSGMFRETSVFNQDIGGWDVSSVKTMSSMFSKAAAFNQDIGAWNVGNVTTMQTMFYINSVFNQDISEWNVSSVTNMASMFSQATVFNQDISSWDVSNVTIMRLIFSMATSFDQDLSNWNIQGLTSSGLNDISFSNSGMSCENYSRTIKAWSLSSNLPENIDLSANSIEYSPEITDIREFLELENGWTITGDSEGTCSIACDPYTETINEEACNEFTWTDGNGQTYFESGEYEWETNDEEGCEYTVILDLTINNPTLDPTVTVDGETLTALEEDATYQWIDCSDNSPIDGATSQSFTATTGGSYAVILTSTICESTTATSDCEVIEVFGLTKLDVVAYEVYPNPATSTFTISGLTGNETVKLYDLNGSVIQTKIATEKQEQVDINSLAKGIYTLMITTTDGVVTKFKVVKE